MEYTLQRGALSLAVSDLGAEVQSLRGGEREYLCPVPAWETQETGYSGPSNRRAGVCMRREKEKP